MSDSNLRAHAVPRRTAAALSVLVVAVAVSALLPAAALAGPNSWTASPHPPRGIMSMQVHTYAGGTRVLLAGTYQGAYETTDGAATWHSMGDGLVDGSRITWDVIRCADGTSVAACSDGIYRLRGGESAWSLVSGSDNARSIRRLAENSGRLIGGGDLGIFTSADHGANWNPVPAGPPNVRIYSLSSLGTTLVAGSYITTGGAYASTDGGSTWTTLTTGIPSDVMVNRIATTTAGIWIAAHDALYLSANGGGSWTSVRDGNFFGVTSRPGGGIVVAAFDGTFWETSSPVGASGWTSHTALVEHGAEDLFTEGTKVFAVYRNIGVYSQTLPAWSTATEANAGLPFLAVQPTHVTKAGVYLAGAFLDHSGCGLYRSTDKGVHWSLVANPKLVGHNVVGFDENAAGRVITLSDSGVMESTDTVTWTLQGNPGQPGGALAFGLDDTTTIIADTGNRVFTWQEGQVAASQLPTTGLPDAEQSYSVAQAADGAYLVGKQSGIYRLPNGGSSWALVWGGAPSSAGIVRTSDGTICAAQNLNGLAVSRDNGQTWASSPGGGTGMVVGIWKRPGDDAVFISCNTGVRETKDLGQSWLQIGGVVPTINLAGLAGASDKSSMLLGSDLGPLLWSAPDAFRVSGKTRYDVGEQIARDGWDPNGDKSWPSVTDIVIASGDDAAMADPLAAAGLAGMWNAPVLTVNKLAVPAQTARVISEIASKNHGVRIHIVGGTGSVPDARWRTIKAIPHVSQVYDRIAGKDRYAVTANIAYRMASEAPKLGIGLQGVLLVCSEKPAAFYDALAVGPLAFHRHMPMLGVKTGSIPSTVRSALTSIAGVALPVFSASGPSFISTPVVNSALAARLTWKSSPYAASADIASYETTAPQWWLELHDVGLTAKLSDALTAGAFMGHQNGPLVFTSSGSTIQPAPAAFISSNAGSISRGWVFGGTVSVPVAQQTQFKHLIQLP